MRARIKVDVRTKPGDHITLGNVDMTVLQAYGHTPGAVSFSFRVTEAGKTYNVLIVNMLRRMMKSSSPRTAPRGGSAARGRTGRLL